MSCIYKFNNRPILREMKGHKILQKIIAKTMKSYLESKKVLYTFCYFFFRKKGIGKYFDDGYCEIPAGLYPHYKMMVWTLIWYMFYQFYTVLHFRSYSNPCTWIFIVFIKTLKIYIGSKSRLNIFDRYKRANSRADTFTSHAEHPRLKS